MPCTVLPILLLAPENDIAQAPWFTSCVAHIDTSSTSMSSQFSHVVPQHSSNIHTLWIMKQFHLSLSVFGRGASSSAGPLLITSALGRTSEKGIDLGTAGLGLYDFHSFIYLFSFARLLCESFSHTLEL